MTVSEQEIDKKIIDLLVKVWLEHFMNKPHNLSEDDAAFLLHAHIDRAKRELDVKK